MTTPTVDPRLYATFVRIINGRRAGSVITVDHIRGELDAAQIPPRALGSYFQSACHRGLLVLLTTAPSTSPAARGRRVGCYKVRRAAPAPAPSRQGVQGAPAGVVS